MRKGLGWEFLLRRIPPERENVWVRVGEDEREEMSRKVAKIEFLQLEIMLEMDIFRQTK